MVVVRSSLCLWLICQCRADLGNKLVYIRASKLTQLSDTMTIYDGSKFVSQLNIVFSFPCFHLIYCKHCALYYITSSEIL